ncbi:hypothetical protein BJI49_08310 [Acetobacter pasteurianus]|nr:hypothetical protein BJI49_08310 [Acetobacter pasteurianus]
MYFLFAYFQHEYCAFFVCLLFKKQSSRTARPYAGLQYHHKKKEPKWVPCAEFMLCGEGILRIECFFIRKTATPAV